MMHQRDKALERAKEARSQEDEYFEENSRLEQQDGTLKTQLTEIETTNNNSQAQNSELRQRVEDLKAEEAREKANSHAAWVKNQGELMQSRRDLKLSMGVNANLEAELKRTEAILTDKERAALGLPPLKKDAKGKKTSAPVSQPAPPAAPVVAAPTAPAVVEEPAAVAPAVAPAAPEPAVTPTPKETAVVPLREKEEDSSAAEPLTPQVGHVKVWETAAEAAKPKKLLSKVASVVAKPEPAKKAAPISRAPVASKQPAVVQAKAVPPAAAVKVKTTPAPLPGEPPKPVDDAAATLASVTGGSDSTPKASSAAPRSALQKLAEFFASPPLPTAAF